MLTQHDALLAWTGHSISSRPTISHKMVFPPLPSPSVPADSHIKSLAHWGNSKLTGRGLVALIGRGQIYQVVLKPGEVFTVHPSSLLAYSMTGPSRPVAHRLRSTSLRLQVPSLGLSRLLPSVDIKALRTLRESQAYRAVARALFAARTWSRRAIWGDRVPPFFFFCFCLSLHCAC